MKVQAGGLLLTRRRQEPSPNISVIICTLQGTGAGIDIPYEKLDMIPDNEMFKFKDYLSGKTDGLTIRIRGEN
jgi:hypothetical protein